MDKERLLEICNSFLGTPFVNGGNIKGAGVDCCTLQQGILEEYYGKKINIPTDYAVDWFFHKECGEIILPHLEKYCERVEELQIGDIISYRWGRAEYAHLSVYIGDGRVAHCRAYDGVEITEMDSPIFYDGKGNSRVTGYWRAKL